LNWKDVLRKGDAWEMEQGYGMDSADIVDMFAQQGADYDRMIDSKLARANSPELKQLAQAWLVALEEFRAVERGTPEHNAAWEKVENIEEQIYSLANRLVPDEDLDDYIENQSFNAESARTILG